MTTTSNVDAVVPAKVMRLRYAGTCAGCGAELESGTRAHEDRSLSRTHRGGRAGAFGAADNWPASALDTGATPDAAETGAAGSCARRESERRSAKREAPIREAHPQPGGLILAVTDEPKSTTAWVSGARGEKLLGARLADLTEKGVRLLHNRRVPGTRANIDHITLGPAGVHVIDA